MYVAKNLKRKIILLTNEPFVNNEDCLNYLKISYFKHRIVNNKESQEDPNKLKIKLFKTVSKNDNKTTS